MVSAPSRSGRRASGRRVVDRRVVDRRALGRRAFAVALGLAADWAVGEPAAWHPVAGFGSAMAALERRMWADRRVAGVAYAAAGVGGAAGAGLAARRLAGPAAALAWGTWISVAGRYLLEAASAVADALDAGDLEHARTLLPVLVGRSPDGLGEEEVARAVVESVAENLSDAVVASALWGLVAGAPGVLAHRAANTLDAMVGHRDARHGRFGWASARADDALGWPAARLTALLAAGSRPSKAVDVWRAVRRDAPRHPSPNAGVPEAAFAAVLGLRLGGANRYGDRVEVRPMLGEGRPPEAADIRAAVALARRVTVLLFALAVLAGAVLLGAPGPGWPRRDDEAARRPARTGAGR